MRILFVTPYPPSPPRFGGQRRLDGIIRGLARRHEVSLLSLVDPTCDVEGSRRAAEVYCRTVVLVPNDRCGFSTMRKRIAQARSLLSRHSFERFFFRSAPLQRALRMLTMSGAFDVINFEFAQMAANRQPSNGLDDRAPIFVLDEHNIEFEIVQRTAASACGIDRRLYSHLDWRKLEREERDAWRRFDGCTVTSERDEAILRRSVPSARTAVVPNGVDDQYFKPTTATAPCEPGSLLFFGAGSYHPNTDGLLFFLREILPRVRARCPQVKLRILGPSIPAAIQAFAGPRVEVTGFVDDVRPYLERASVIVVPLRIGGGTRFKIVEAMAMGRPVVSTRVGAEGLDVRSGSDILLADGAEDFAMQVVRLLDDPALARSIGAAGRRLVERNYTWGASVGRLERFYAELMTRRPVSV